MWYETYGGDWVNEKHIAIIENRQGNLFCRLINGDLYSITGKCSKKPFPKLIEETQE